MAVHANILLVEGKQDLHVIAELMEANGVDWGDKKKPVVYIRDCDGYQNLVSSEAIATELQASGLAALGVKVQISRNRMLIRQISIPG